MPEEFPALPGLEGFVPKLRAPLPSNYPGTLFEISSVRATFIGITACLEPGAQSSRKVKLSELTEEGRLWEKLYGVETAARLMAEHRAVFWGCPQETFSVLVSRERHPDFDSYPRSFSTRFDSPGKVCLTHSGNVASALDSPERYSHPVIFNGISKCSTYDDSMFELAAGSYVVTVTQMFRWKSAQFASLRPGAIHYHVHFRAATLQDSLFSSEIPWLCPPVQPSPVGR